MITIIDYGLGNIRAFVNIYKRLNIEVMIAHSADEIKHATKIILPGVGSFDFAMAQLTASGMRGELEHQVLVNKIPVLGICVGMQILGNSSEEGSRTGLGWIKGKVKRFDTTLIPFHTKLPHMGWNTITPVKKCYLLNSFNENDRFYFLHSYYFECEDQTDVAAETDFGNKFSSAINYKNIYGIQFHPEKSHSNGVRLLNNFSNI